jgi:hypothetical protein
VSVERGAIVVQLVKINNRGPRVVDADVELPAAGLVRA